MPRAPSPTAHNRSVTNADGTVTDRVELHNPSSAPFDLSDHSLSSDPANPRRWVFPAGASFAADSYLVVRLDNAAPASTNNDPTLNTGFGLDADGDKVLLYDTPANGGRVVLVDCRNQAVAECLVATLRFEPTASGAANLRCRAGVLRKGPPAAARPG